MSDWYSVAKPWVELVFLGIIGYATIVCIIDQARLHKKSE